MKPNYLLLTVLFLFAPAMVLADETDHVGCDQVMLKAVSSHRVIERQQLESAHAEHRPRAASS